MDYDALFNGLNEAHVTERLPKITDGDFTFQVLELKNVDGHHGFSLVIELRVLESDNPDFPAGSMGSISINGLRSDNKTKRSAALGNVKGFLGAALHIDPESPQQWMGIAKMMIERELLQGAVLCTLAATVQTKPDQTGKSYNYIRHTYREFAENPRTMTAILADMSQQQGAA
jgi:hypothetical protein